MSLTHVAARTTYHPERFENDETGLGYSVRADTDAPDPRADLDVEHAALWAYRQPTFGSSSIADKPEGNPVIDAFSRLFLDVGYRQERTIELTRRWANIFFPGKYQIEIQTIRGYSQGDWLDIVAVVEQGHGKPSDHIKELRMWVYGDVWVVSPDTKPGICNIYADSAEEALTYFRENFEDAEPAKEEAVLEATPSDDDLVSELELIVGTALDADAWKGNDDDVFALVKQGYELGARHALRTATNGNAEDTQSFDR